MTAERFAVWFGPSPMNEVMSHHTLEQEEPLGQGRNKGSLELGG
jgi:hypothetical protein